MNSGFTAPGMCGRCGHGLIGKVKNSIRDSLPKPGQKGFEEILRDPNNFKLFGCFNCGTESTNLADLTAVTPEFELRRALRRKAELEASILWYEGAIPLMKKELGNIEKGLPEFERKVGESSQA